MTTPRPIPPSDSVAGHLRNALQLLRTARADVDAVDRRIVAALTLIEAPEAPPTPERER